jgi:hypothetical protein
MRSWRLSNHRPKKENREKLSAGSKDRVEMGGWNLSIGIGAFIKVDIYIGGTKELRTCISGAKYEMKM